MRIDAAVEQYVDYRKSLGEKFRTSGYALRGLARYVGGDTETGEVTIEQCSAYLLHPKGVVTGGWFVKLSALRGFFSWAVARGHAESSPIPKDMPKPVGHARPYIYTNDEIKALLLKSGSVWTKWMSIRPNCARMIILTTYVLGLRISETLGIRIGDLDLDASLVRITGTKFHKSRIVTFNDVIASEIRSFLTSSRNLRSPDDKTAPLFPNSRGKMVGADAFRGYFRRARSAAGICGPDGAAYQPRIHDLRHTFAVRRLTEWYRQGKDVQRLLPVLSTYLGHKNIDNTSVYLTMTNELLGEANRLFGHYTGQEVIDDDQR